jgi:NitT/TauT family transport system permease protein
VPDDPRPREPEIEVVAFRGGGFAPRQRGWISWATALAILLAWAAASRLGIVDPLFLPSPIEVVAALWHLTVNGTLLLDVGLSLMRIGAGWGIGTAVGLIVGLAMGISTVGRSIGTPIIGALFPIPKIALLPLLILWFGIGEPSKIATIALGVFFPTAISTFSGVDNIARNLIRMGLSFNLPSWAIVYKIVLPGALPSILAGFRISSSFALILVISAEMVGAEHGLGAFTLQAGNLMQTDQLLAGVTVLSILGLVIHALLTWIERKALSWR